VPLFRPFILRRLAQERLRSALTVAGVALGIAVSSTRSTTIVANADVALSPSLRASSQGRSTSPARAGSTAVAAKPMMVVVNALRRLTRPMGARRYRQRIARNR
jgi:hypothetical protein